MDQQRTRSCDPAPELPTGSGHSFGLRVSFFGVRGSTPCSGPRYRRIGGNTACVGLEVTGERAPDSPTVFFDFGTGARELADRHLRSDRPFDGVCLLTHAHWDHIQGIPFFPPLLRRPEDRVTVYSPRCETGQTLPAVLGEVMSPPMFPVRLSDLPGTFEWVEVTEGGFRIAEMEVMARLVPHTGRTVGYRVSAHGLTVTYIPDHQQPVSAPEQFFVEDGVRQLAADADLLIFDSQYTREEFDRKANWGHSTVRYAGWVAQQVGAKRLAMFHHDPAHDDETIDRLVQRAQSEIDGVEVFAAAQGESLSLEASRPFDTASPVQP